MGLSSCKAARLLSYVRPLTAAIASEQRQRGPRGCPPAHLNTPRQSDFLAMGTSETSQASEYKAAGLGSPTAISEFPPRSSPTVFYALYLFDLSSHLLRVVARWLCIFYIRSLSSSDVTRFSVVNLVVIPFTHTRTCQPPYYFLVWYQPSSRTTASFLQPPRYRLTSTP